MKKIYYLLLVFSFSFTYASSLGALNQLYTQKKYQNAYTQTQAYLKENPLNLKANLLLADSAYMLGDLDEAMAAYDRVLIIDPNNIYAKIQEAKIYAKSGYKDISILETKALLARHLTNEQKREVLKLKNSLENAPASKKSKDQALLKGVVSVGLLHDTNPNSNIGEKSFTIPGLNLNYRGEKQKKDTAHFEQLYLVADKNLHNSIGVFATLNAYNRSYFDMSNNNLSYLFANISPYYKAEEFKIYLPLIFNKVFLEHNSYTNTYGTGIDIKKDIKNGILETGYRYYQNRYYGKNKDKDSSHHSLYAGIKYTLMDDLLAYLYIKYANNQEKKDLRNDVNYNSYGFDIGLNKQILQSLIFRTNFGFKTYSYKDFNKVFLNKRDDKVYNFGLGLTYIINNSSSIEFDINYMDRTSNQFLYEYDRFLTSLNYAYKF